MGDACLRRQIDDSLRRPLLDTHVAGPCGSQQAIAVWRKADGAGERGQVNVGVDQAGQHQLPGRVVHLTRPVGGDFGFHGGHPIAAQPDVEPALSVVDRIDQEAAFDQQVVLCH